MQYVPGDWQNKSKKMIKNLSRTDIENLISEWVVGRYAERDRSIMKRRLIDGRTYEQLAEEFDMSVRQIQNIIYKRQEDLLKHMPLE